MEIKQIPPILRIPSHVKAFSCSQCGICCTNKWRIDIDDLSFATMYKPFERLGRERELHDAMLFRHKGQQIRFLPNGKCPFLSDKNLCTIQLQFGSECMADICKVYPRRIFSSPRGLEFSLSLSCATATRTLIQPKITIECIHYPAFDQQHNTFFFIPPNTFEEYSPLAAPLSDVRRHYYHLEELFLTLLQNREYPLSQRLIALGKVIEASASFHSLDEDQLTHSLAVALYDSAPGEPKVKEHLRQLHLIISSYLTRSIPTNGPPVPLGAPSLSTANTVSPGKKALQIMRAKVLTLSAEEYGQKLDQYYYSAFDSVSTILENYLVNFILSKHFFFHAPYLAYYNMAFSYAVSIAFALGYCIETSQSINQQLMLQAICDVENLFYQEWFYRHGTALQAEYGDARVMENSMALVHV